jgi:hypothetical protein
VYVRPQIRPFRDEFSWFGSKTSWSMVYMQADTVGK